LSMGVLYGQTVYVLMYVVIGFGKRAVRTGNTRAVKTGPGSARIETRASAGHPPRLTDLCWRWPVRSPQPTPVNQPQPPRVALNQTRRVKSRARTFRSRTRALAWKRPCHGLCVERKRRCREGGQGGVLRVCQETRFLRWSRSRRGGIGQRTVPDRGLI
jgi:hypothetical protein